MYGEIMQAFKTKALTFASPFTAIDNGSIPTENGLAMYLSAGADEVNFMDDGGIFDLDIVLNGKHSNLQTLVTALSNIHVSMSQQRFSGGTWRVIKISTSTPPNYIGQEDSGQWLYGSIFNIKFSYKGVA